MCDSISTVVKSARLQEGSKAKRRKERAFGRDLFAPRRHRLRSIPMDECRSGCWRLKKKCHSLLNGRGGGGERGGDRRVIPRMRPPLFVPGGAYCSRRIMRMLFNSMLYGGTVMYNRCVSRNAPRYTTMTHYGGAEVLPFPPR